MKTLRNLLIAIIVGLMFVVIVCQHCALKNPTVEDPTKVYNIFEMQERLKAQGLYKGKVDGIWGKETDRAYSDYCAIKEIEGR